MRSCSNSEVGARAYPQLATYRSGSPSPLASKNSAPQSSYFLSVTHACPWVDSTKLPSFRWMNSLPGTPAAPPMKTSSRPSPFTSATATGGPCLETSYGRSGCAYEGRALARDFVRQERLRFVVDTRRGLVMVAQGGRLLKGL